MRVFLRYLTGPYCCAAGYVGDVGSGDGRGWSEGGGDAGVEVVSKGFFPEVVLVFESGGGFKVAA